MATYPDQQVNKLVDPSAYVVAARTVFARRRFLPAPLTMTMPKMDSDIGLTTINQNASAVSKSESCQ